MVNILVIDRLAAASNDVAQILSDPWADKFKATMGALVRQLEPHTQADPELAADLAEALRRRNYLAHAFWREQADDFCTDEGRSRMISYLIETRKFFEDVDQRLTATIGAAAMREWVTPEVINAWYHDTAWQIERGELNVPISVIESARDHMLDKVTRQTP